MIGRVGMVCAAGLLTAATGCALQYGNSLFQVGVQVNEQVVNDSLDRVAQKLEREMRRLGLEVVVSQDASIMRLTSTSKAGQKFDVLLSKAEGPQGERTQVRVEWEKAPDAALWAQLAAVLVVTPT
jgi:hypothetical protein